MFDNIAIFISLVETGSFSKAAEILNLSQATVSRKIAELEKYVEQLLFVRDTRNLQLSPNGIILYSKFKSMRQDLKDAIFEMNPVQIKKSSSVLTVCLHNTISLELICPYIKYYTNQFPGITINLVFYSVDLINEINFDIGISYRNLDIPTYHAKAIRQDCMKLYATPHYVTKYGLPRIIEELENHHLIGCLDNINNNLQPVDHFILINKYTKDEHLFNINKFSKIKTNSALHAKQLAVNSNNIFWCWESFCEQDVLGGKLIPVLPEFSISRDNTFYLVYKDDLSHEGTKFCEYLYRCMEQKLSVGYSQNVIEKNGF